VAQCLGHRIGKLHGNRFRGAADRLHDDAGAVLQGHDRRVLRRRVLGERFRQRLTAGGGQQQPEQGGTQSGEKLHRMAHPIIAAITQKKTKMMRCGMRRRSHAQLTTKSSAAFDSGRDPNAVTSEALPCVIAKPFFSSKTMMWMKNTMPGAASTGLP